MTEQKIISVLGATGVQGGAVARALLADGEFAVRAVTRDAGSASAKELAALGADVVEADLYDVVSLRRAFDGAYGAYLVTPFFTHLSAAQELIEVTNLVDAAAGLRHVVWSTLEDTREAIPLHDDRMPTIDEKYKVPHFDVKGGEADRLFAEAGLPTTYVRMSFYWNNMLADLAPHPQARRHARAVPADGRVQDLRHRRRGHRQGDRERVPPARRDHRPHAGPQR